MVPGKDTLEPPTEVWAKPQMSSNPRNFPAYVFGLLTNAAALLSFCKSGPRAKQVEHP